MNQPIPIYLPFKPKNRRERRTYLNEVHRNIGLIDELEVGFLNDLFDDDDAPFAYDYSELYSLYLDKYKELMDWMGRCNKFKHTVPNPKYFMQKYKPLETEFELNIPYTF